MKNPEVTVIDYGAGNLLSVRQAFEYLGATVHVTADPEFLLTSSRVVLPGVGAFAKAMFELQELNLTDVINQIAVQGTPLLGICLGMQLLMDESEEFGTNAGLGLIPGMVIPIPALTATGQPQKIPHIGWNELIPTSKNEGDWLNTPLQNISPGEAVYFVHSFMAIPDDPNHRVADCLYGGLSISAAIAKDNIFGCQFHPEKSGEVGLKILKSFLDIKYNKNS
ncbi:imidazole glycerol phosphate synthase subunit HisH [Geitlerinema sp. CS-897]|nr:imidazole glycerol phosphate synthase subunit HisH [Geitlerinema sp. CS-897]